MAMGVLMEGTFLEVDRPSPMRLPRDEDGEELAPCRCRELLEDDNDAVDGIVILLVVVVVVAVAALFVVPMEMRIFVCVCVSVCVLGGSSE